MLRSLLPLFLLAASAVATPFAYDTPLIVTRNFFLDTNVRYTSQHDVVNIVVPLNRINFDDDGDSDVNDDSEHVTVFFVEADINNNEDREDKGLYMLKKGKTTKILDNGRDATAFNDESKKVYLGASDGVYVYDGTNGTTTKYGTLTDNIIQIAANNQTSTIYFLTKSNEVYSIADEGTKKNKVENLKDVKEIVFDFKNNLYYSDVNKDLYILNEDGVKKFNGIPKRNAVKLVKPMFAQDEGIFAVIDDTIYLLTTNGTAIKTKITLNVKPTAYAPETTLIHYYALDKKIYEFNVMQIVESELGDLKEFLNEKMKDIQTIATKSRSSFGE